MQKVIIKTVSKHWAVAKKIAKNLFILAEFCRWESTGLKQINWEICNTNYSKINQN